MSRTLSVAFIASLRIAGTLSLLGQTPSAGIEQQLRSQYRIASVGSNGVVVRAGTVVVVQQDGITALPAPGEYPCNSHKEGGRISHSAMCAINYSVSKDNQRPLQVGEKAYLTAIQVKPTEIVFKVQTCCSGSNDAPSRAAVSFQFPKGYLDSVKLKEVQDAIGQIFVPDAGSSAQGSDQSQPNPPQGVPQTPVAGLYSAQQTGAQLQLNPDGSFSLHTANGQVSPGHYTVNGNKLVLTYTATGLSTTPFTIQGDKIYAGARLGWIRQGDVPPPVVPQSAPLRLPATYASAKTPADQLQLNADNSFSLQEGGQAYKGTFVANGNAVELNITGGPKTTATLEGNNLTDSGGQVWVLGEQPARSAGGDAVLQNQDVIKLVKAGLDDTLIIAKIGNSKCQFDTSTDALIQLKESGISATVLKAMLGGQNVPSSTTPVSTIAPTNSITPSSSSPELPTAYGYYILDRGQYRDLRPTAVAVVIGLSVPASGTGFAVDGLSGNPSAAVDTEKPELLVYQQNVDVASLKLAKLDFIRNMQASQFNMIGTNAQFFRNIYGVDYNQAVAVNLWRPQEQDIPLKTEPVAGRNGMFRLIAVRALAPGRYTVYLGDTIHKVNMIFGTRSNTSTSTAFYFEVRGGGK